jgi:hypothetical protein
LWDLTQLRGDKDATSLRLSSRLEDPLPTRLLHFRLEVRKLVW